MNKTDIKVGVIDLWDIDIGDWSIDLSNPMVMVATALLLASLLLTIRASWRRLYPRSLSRAMMVILANLVAFTTVLTLLIEPQRMHRIKQDVVLLTEGTDLSTIGLPGGASVYIAPGITTTAETLPVLRNANWLLDIEQLPLREPALTNINVKGFGLSRTQWQNLPADVRIAFQPPPLSGFNGMSWPRILVTGDTLRINGRFSNPGSEAVITLRLLDPAGRTADEVRTRSEDYFFLSARPRGHGNLEYALQAWAGERLLSAQVLTVSVRTPPAINIMVEQSAPSFETRQLKNFAAGNGARVLINTRISRGKSISQSTNLPDNTEVTFSPQSLAQQDVLIMDGRAVVNLAEQQQRWLADAVVQGLGLLILADTSLVEEFMNVNSGLLKGFELTSSPDAKTRLVPRLINNLASGWQQPLPVAAMQLQAIDADLLIDDGNDRALVINKAKGLGHIAISLISQSHRWLTAGNRDHWSDYWASLIVAVGRTRSDTYLLPQNEKSFLRVGKRTPVCAMSTGKNLVATIISTNSNNTLPEFEIPLSVDSLGSSRQCGWFWPQQNGWHQIHLRAGADGQLLDQQGLFIFDKYQWLSQSRHERVLDTQKRSSITSRSQIKSNTEKWVSEPLEVFWLYLLLVSSASMLWLERKQFYFQ